MLNAHDILETITMIQEENLDVRTVTMGISLLDCCDADMALSLIHICVITIPKKKLTNLLCS